MKQITKCLLLLASTTVAVPYTVALLCNILYGWPQSRDKYKRAFHPRKVFALNYSVLQTFLRLQYIPLLVRWKSFYNSADRSILAKDLPFGRNDRTLDIYTSLQFDDNDVRPVVIFIYGGTWGSGDKSMYGLLCMEIANKLGAVVCCPNYSLYPQGYVDDMIQDVVDAVNWVHENIVLYGGDKEKIMLVGHSAGAHLSAMAILELLHDERTQASPVKRRQLKFEEGHYAGSNNGTNGSESSDSFAIVGDNGEQQNVPTNGTTTSMFEVLDDQQESLPEEEASPIPSLEAESSIVDEPLEQLPEENKDVTEKSGSDRVSGGGDGQEEEDSGDDDSVVTVRPKEIERHATLVDLCKSIKAFVGLAGVYHIGEHYNHEEERGIEDISSMGRAMYGDDHFERFSPTYIINNLGRCISLPKIVLLHGTEDVTVPLTSSTKFADSLSEVFADVTVRLMTGCNHTDLMIDLMDPSRRFYDSVMGVLLETSHRVF